MSKRHPKHSSRYCVSSVYNSPCCSTPPIRGPPGIQGVTGPSFVPINNTVFVDQQFGSASGSVEDLTDPFQTLAQGLAAAIAQGPSADNQWTVYIQPGNYSTETLNLIDGVNFYINVGAIISNTDGPIFVVDTGTNFIEGYGQFEVDDTVLLITGPAMVEFEANTIVSNTPSNTNSLFHLTNLDEAPGSLSIEVNMINHVQTTPVILIDGNVNINCELDWITAAGIFIQATILASGFLLVNTQRIEGGDPSQTGDGNPLGSIILNQSDRFVMEIASQLFRSHSLTQAIQSTSSVPPVGPTQQISTFVDVQEIYADGGIAFVHGVQPPDPINQVFGSKVSIHSQFIQALTLIDVTLFHCENFGIMSISSDIIYERFQLLGTPTEPMVKSIESTVFINSKISAPLTNRAFVVSSVIPGFGNLTVNSIQIFCALALLEITGNAGAVITSEITFCFGGPAPNVLIDTNSNVQLSINLLQLQVNGAGPGTEVAAIDIITGSLAMSNFFYGFGGDFVYGIRKRTGGGDLIVESDSISGFGNSVIIIYITDGGNNILDAYNINSSNQIILLDGNATLQSKVINLSSQGTTLTMNDSSSFIGYLGNINCQNGPSINNDSSNICNMLFNAISTSQGAQAIYLTGQGSTYLLGNLINTQNCNEGIVVGDGTTNTNLSLKVQDLIIGVGGTIDSGITVNALNGAASIDYQRLFMGGSTNNAVINCILGVTDMRGTSTPNLNTDFILVSQVDNANAASFRGYFGQITSNNATILTIENNNETWFHADLANNNGIEPVVDITAPVDGPTYTVGGVLRTGGQNAILLNGPNSPNYVRVLGSTLFNDPGGNSIAAVGFVGTPTVIIEPSIANTFAVGINQVPDPTVVLPPYGSLIVDANVQ
jgi:hypothetical protein